MRMLFWVAVGLLSLAGSVTAGEVTVKLTATEHEKVPYIVPLVVPAATCAATGDALGIVAVGHKVEKRATLSLFRLDAAGKPAGAPVVVPLPKPATLAARETYPLSIIFHPSLPLLYVWQEVEALKGDPMPPADPAWKDFDHLHIYALDTAIPELLLSLCRSSRFHTGTVAGTLCFDGATGRLYVPNLRYGKINPPEYAAVGWFSLGGDGLPVAADEEPVKPEPAVAREKAAADRPARLAALRTALAADKPVGAFRQTPDKTYGFHAFPCGAGFVPISRDVFIAAGPFGPVTWNAADRRAQALVFLMPVNFVTYYCTRMTSHPRLPVVYATMAGYPYANRVEHADGYLTLAPQVAHIDGAALRTGPVVLTKRNLIAWGSTGAVHIAGIDAEGRFKAEGGLQVTVPSATVDGLAYSEKFDLLYVAVEKAK